jgi:hypothetical protein
VGLGVWCFVLGVWRLLSWAWALGVWCLVFWDLVFVVRNFGIWCLVWSLVFWVLRFGVWCLVFLGLELRGFGAGSSAGADGG